MEPHQSYSLAFNTSTTERLGGEPIVSQAIGPHPTGSPQQHYDLDQRLNRQPSQQLRHSLNYQHQQQQGNRLLHKPLLSSHNPSHLTSASYYALDQYQTSERHVASIPVQPCNTNLSLSIDPDYPAMASQPIGSNNIQNESLSLPLPSYVLPSQAENAEPCVACGKPKCCLLSHKNFSQRILADTKRKQSQCNLTYERTPRQIAALPGRIMQPPLNLDPERDHLLSLWSRSWSLAATGGSRALERHLFPTPMIDRVLPAAQQHPPLLQSLLAYSGVVHDLTTNPSAVSDVALRQQSFAVELLSQACPTEAEAGADEAMLAATFLLLIYMMQGNALEVNKHVSGLVHLVTLRGGLHYLGLRGLVAETLMYADAMQAIFFSTEPMWSFPLPPLNIGLPPRMGNGFRKTINEPTSVGATASGMNHTLVSAALSVCKVADIFELAGRTPEVQLPREAANGFGYLSMVAEYQLAKYNAEYHGSGTLGECICLALILFNKVVLRYNGAVTPDVLAVEYRFWSALSEMESKGLSTNSGLGVGIDRRMYMWLCFMGLNVSVPLLGGGQTSQFWTRGVERIRACQALLDMSDWISIRGEVLENFCWVSATQEEVFHRAWMEAERAKPIYPVPSTISDGKSRIVNGLAFQRTKFTVLPPPPTAM